MTDTGEALWSAVHFIVTKVERHFFPGLLHVDRIVHVRLVEECALFAVEIEEAILKDALADFAHELVVKIDVVLPDELPAEVFVALREVMQIRTRVARTRGAVAERIEFVLGEFINAATQLQKPTRSERAASLSDLCGNDAVKHVHAAMHCFEQIERRAYAHEVAREILREKLRGEFASVLTLAAALADCKAADGVSIERHFAQTGCTFAPQLWK